MWWGPQEKVLKKNIGTSQFNNMNKRHATELVNYIQDLKDTNTDFKINRKCYAEKNLNLVLYLVVDFVTQTKYKQIK